MKTGNVPRRFVTRLNSLILVGVFMILAAVVAVPFYSAASNSLSPDKAARASASREVAAKTNQGLANRTLWRSNYRALPLTPQGPGETIATYEVVAGVCTAVPKNSFNLGETVCAIVTGAPLGDPGRAARRIGWVSPYGSLAQGAEVTTDPQIGYYTIPTDATQTFTDAGGGTVIVDNRGVWNVGIYSASDGSFREAASFTVHDPAKAFVDLYISQSVTAAEGSVGAGSSSVFEIFAKNYGPDAATDVVISDTVPNNTSDQSITDHGSGFSCGAVSGGVINCTLASLPAGATAHLTFNYSVNTGTSAGTILTNVVSISSSATPCAPDSTCEIKSSDNSSSASVTVAGTGGSGTCTLNCPDNVNAVADTTEGGQRGAHVTFDAAEPSGTCGAVTATPASGSFFPVGSTVVGVSSETGGGSCSFVVTVEDTGTNPPNISCPANQTASADSDCSATVNVGTATATGDNVTIFATRSDGKPMYTCDANGTNCVRRSSDDPFSSGVTTITWIAHSHNAPGPYADEDDEIAHRTGAASCTQTVTVNDTTPPVITATDSTASADSNCMAPVPDYSNAVSDNCSCAANDNSQDCVGQHRITTTQDPAAGTMVGLGPHTIHLTANDGSSNNDGAGNTSQKDVTFTVNDITPPTVTCPAPTSASADANCQAPIPDVTSGATASDNCGAVTLTQDPAAGTMVGAGSHTITVTATDGSGNSSTCTTTFTVNDTTPPTVSCPAPTSASADANCQAPVPDVASSATASDNCSAPGSITKTQDPAAGTMVGKGTHTITVTATDPAGNSSTCTTTFTVNDTTPPAITCPNNVTTVSLPGSCSASVAVGVATATDNCDGTVTPVPSRSDNKPITDPYPVGTVNITWTATDSTGNSSSCLQTITVNDNEPPTITCPANMTAATEPGTCSAHVITGTATATDNCGIATVSGARSDGQSLTDPYPKGTTVITWTATDLHGNQSSCMQTVTVVDNEAPKITFNGQTPSMWPPNHAYNTFTTANFISSVSDNCDSLSVNDVYITKVTSDEAENAGGSGNTLNDIVISGDCKSVQLRAERINNGNGRVYTIYFKLRDSSGNFTTGTAKVYSPKNEGETPGDDGPHYTVTSSCP